MENCQLIKVLINRKNGRFFYNIPHEIFLYKNSKYNKKAYIFFTELLHFLNVNHLNKAHTIKCAILFFYLIECNLIFLVFFLLASNYIKLNYKQKRISSQHVHVSFIMLLFQIFLFFIIPFTLKKK